jgi:MFS family permease
MYVSSPLSGWLRDRLGRLPTIGVVGLVLLNALGAALLVVPLAATWLHREALAALAIEPNPWAS